MNANSVNVENLQRGLQQLFAYRSKKGQPAEGEWDFNNSLYTELQGFRSGGLNKEFWNFLVDELWNWSAIRPNSKQQIHAAGVARLQVLQKCIDKLAVDSSDNLPAMDQVEWEDVSTLFSVAQQIKPVAGEGRSMFARSCVIFLRRLVTSSLMEHWSSVGGMTSVTTGKNVEAPG